mmetsp:Transcript_123004/g.200050  ORF Transcript_123004/g.200050 Transcript_123004/m.200050 type:complete len:476 (+) Transcript_123004:157-1584(+)
MAVNAGYGATNEASLTTAAAGIEKLYRHRVILFTCFLCLVVVAEGYDIGVLNGAVVRMKDNLGLSTLQISLVVTMTPLFLMPGSLAGGAVADACGRRGALVLCCALLVGGPLGMALSTSPILLMVARAVVGFGIGMGYVVVSMYIAEVAPAEMRGRLTTLEDVFLNVGILLGYFVNWLLYGMPNDWRWMLSLGSILPFLVCAALFHPHMPESPRWLHARGRDAEAEEVLTYFVGAEESKQAVNAMAEQGQKGEKEEFVTWRSVLCSWHDKPVRRMLLAGIAVACASTACGYLAVAYYSSTVLKMSMSERTAFAATVVMGVAKLLVVIFVLMVLEQTGRRILLLASTVLCGFACAWLAVAYAVQAHGWIQALGFIIFMAGFSLGLGPITLLYISEVFATRWRGKGMALAIFVSRMFAAASTLVFPVLIEAIGVSTSFLLLTGMNGCLVFLIWAFVFETHGLTLESVDELLKPHHCI